MRCFMVGYLLREMGLELLLTLGWDGNMFGYMGHMIDVYCDV